MRPLPQLLLTLLVVAAGLVVYDAVRRPPAEGGADALGDATLEGRVEQLAAAVRALEDRLAAATAPPAAGGGTAPPGAPAGELTPAELDRLESVVRELERRRELARLRGGVETQLAALGLALDDAQRARAVDLLVRFQAERADLWRVAEQEGLRDRQEIARRYAPIRERCEASLRNALPAEAASALVQAFLGP